MGGEDCSLDGRSLLLLDKEVRLTKFVEFIPQSLRSGTESTAPITAVSSNSDASKASVLEAKESAKKEAAEGDLFENEKAPKTVLAEESDDEERVVIRKLRRESALEPLKEIEDLGIPTEETDRADLFVEPDRPAKLHDMFMSCASEMVQDRCFLAWNEVGLIIKRFADGVSSIEIEFSDRRKKRILFSETGDIVVASLSPAGAVLGGVVEDENGHVSGFIVYRAFNAWSARSSWHVDLAGDELPDLVACTDSMVFVYSSRGLLRSWSVCGLQKSVLTPCNHVVSMVGDSDRLAMIYEDSPPMNGLLRFFCFFRRIPLSQTASLPHFSLPSRVRRPGSPFFAVFASLDRVFAGRLAGHVRQSSAAARSERTGRAAIAIGVFPDGVGAANESASRYEGEAEPGRFACSIEFDLSVEPFFWIVALSLKTVKGVILPSTLTSPPPIPRPFLTVLDVQLPLCVFPRKSCDVGERRRGFRLRKRISAPVLRVSRGFFKGKGIMGSRHGIRRGNSNQSGRYKSSTKRFCAN